jgi:phosphosulfolactate synthase
MNNWWSNLEAPLTGRTCKPRAAGITMIIDKGLSLTEIQALLELNSPFIDLIKLGFGTAVLYPERILTKKIHLARDYAVNLYPGGTLWELAYWRGATSTLYSRLRDLGFEWLEISDGTLPLSPIARLHSIEEASQAGFQVITEVGKKDPTHQPSAIEIARLAWADLKAGAVWVIIEARESGAGIGIYNQNGQIRPEQMEILRDLPPDRVIWEAPQKHQQAALINLFGPNVNLGNLPSTEALALEALRRGLRNDTWDINGRK